MHDDGETTLFATGRYLDRLDVGAIPAFRFIERLVVLDSQKIDTLLVIPAVIKNCGRPARAPFHSPPRMAACGDRGFPLCG